MSQPETPSAANPEPHPKHSSLREEEIYISTETAARIIGCDQSTIRTFASNQKIVAKKVAGRWFIDKASVLSYQKTKGQDPLLPLQEQKQPAVIMELKGPKLLAP